MFRFMTMTAVLVFAFLAAGSCTAEVDSDDALPLLQTFVKELVEITPGEGTFPAQFQMG
jgi:hypothetical protein